MLAVNPAFERHTGLTDVVGKWSSELLPGIEQEWHEAYGRVARSGEPMRFEREAARLGRWYDAHLFPAGTHDNHVAMLIVDITPRRRVEQQLRDSERDAGAARCRSIGRAAPVCRLRR